MKTLIVVFLVLVMVSSADATFIVADADGYSDGTDISTAFSGMTLSSVGGYPGLDGLVYAWSDGLASTPTSVFANNLQSFQRQWSAHITDTEGFAFRADFDGLANSVAIDIIGDDSSGDVGGLYAYNSAGVLLESDESHPLGYGDVFTVQINRSSFDIAYIIAGGAASTGDSVHLDNLVANIIPAVVSHRLIGEHLLEVGNQWEYQLHVTEYPGLGQVDWWGTATWAIVGNENVAGYDTVAVEQTYTIPTPTWTLWEKQNWHLTSEYLVQTRYVTEYTIETVRNNNPFEWLPVWVEESDDSRHVGNGEFYGESKNPPYDTWTTTKDSYITFLRTELITIPAGTFDCIVVLVRTDWQNSVGGSGYEEITIWSDLEVGIIKFNRYNWNEGGFACNYTLKLTSAIGVKGIDVSSWQGCEEKGGQDIDWLAVHSAGYRFALVRASWGDEEAPLGIDDCFTTNMENAKANDMLVGAYHLAYPEDTDAASEARHFFNVAKDYLKEGNLMPALDIEDVKDDDSYPYRLGPEELSDWVNKWMDTVQALARHELGTEVEPMLYVNRTYANFLDEHLADVYDLWIAHPTCNPDDEPDTKKWNNWAFWQYYMPVPDGPCPDNSTGPNSVPGIDGTVDLDVFNGNMSKLNTFKISAWQPDFWILYHLCSPADMVVTDPDGLIISKELNQIPGAAYVEIDIDQDGDLDKEISIPYKKVGYYQITVVPEPNALPDDIYSLEAMIDGESMVLAEDVPIGDIPAEPYVFESKLNRSDFDTDGDVDFVDYAVLASHWMNHDCNYPDWCGGTDLDYKGLVDFNDLAIFSDNWLWEKMPADFDIDGDVDFADYAAFALHWMAGNCAELNWCDGADLNKSGSVDLYDLKEFTDNWLAGL